MPKRYLVGRRYEDFLKNGIQLNLSGDEQLWRAMYADPRISPLIERRRVVRRKEDLPPNDGVKFYIPECSLMNSTTGEEIW
jgi:hypothetical protein